jgi:hypothetical protein
MRREDIQISYVDEIVTEALRSVGYILASSNIKNDGESTFILLVCSLVKLDCSSLSLII